MVTADVAIALVESGSPVADDVKLVAPTLLRDDAVNLLFARAAAGEIDRRGAIEVLDGVRSLGMRLLGDRVLQAEAWTVAETLGVDTYRATYVALTRLQADAFVTFDRPLAEAASSLVTVADHAELSA